MCTCILSLRFRKISFDHIPFDEIAILRHNQRDFFWPYWHNSLYLLLSILFYFNTLIIYGPWKNNKKFESLERQPKHCQRCNKGKKKNVNMNDYSTVWKRYISTLQQTNSTSAKVVQAFSNLHKFYFSLYIYNDECDNERSG